MSLQPDRVRDLKDSGRVEFTPDRRTVLKTGAALGALAGPMLVPSIAAAEEALSVPPWMKEQGHPILSPPYGVPSPFEKDVVRRYRELRANARLPYWLVSLGGIHYFPTLQVFLACLPLYAALALGREPWHALDWLALLVTGGAIALETIADEQLRSFNRTKEPGSICARGVWAYSRHPNYLGEIGFWWGVWLFGLAAHPAWAWTVIGPVTMTCLFLFASIPMLEERSMARRPGYAEHVQRVSMLVPWPPRR